MCALAVPGTITWRRQDLEMLWKRGCNILRHKIRSIGEGPVVFATPPDSVPDQGCAAALRAFCRVVDAYGTDGVESRDEGQHIVVSTGNDDDDDDDKKDRNESLQHQQGNSVQFHSHGREEARLDTNIPPRPLLELRLGGDGEVIWVRTLTLQSAMLSVLTHLCHRAVGIPGTSPLPLSACLTHAQHAQYTVCFVQRFEG